MLAAGMVVAGFRVERVLRQDAAGAVYEATQAGLARRVALTIHRPAPGLAERFSAIGAIEHPHLASLYAAGDSEHGFFTATRLVQGPTLDQLAGEGRLEPATRADAVRSGRARPRPCARRRCGARCRVAVERLRRRRRARGPDRIRRGRGRRRARGRSRRPRGHARAIRTERGASHVAAAAACRGSRPRRARARRCGGRRDAARRSGRGRTAGTARSGAGRRPPGKLAHRCDRAVGRLRRTGAERGLAGMHLMQTRLDGRRVTVPEDGAIRGWVVRAARGELALHVIRRRAERFRGRRKLAAAAGRRRSNRRAGGRSRGASRRSDRDRACAGERDRRRCAGGRWRRGAIRRPAARQPAATDAGAGWTFQRELLVRVDYVPGASTRGPRILTGTAAAVAPAGRALSRRDAEVAGRVRQLVLVAVRGRIALDLFAGSVRLRRVPIPGADPRGRLFRLDVPDSTVIWRNPGGRLIEHGVALDAVVALAAARARVPRVSAMARGTRCESGTVAPL